MKESKSITEVLRRLGKKPSTGQHTYIKDRILRLGVDTSHFTGQGWSANQSLYKTDEVFAEGSTIRRSQVRDYILRDNLIPYECAICGNTGEWLGKKLTLQLDHINGVPNDHRLENLRFLCPNCHSQTETYCGKNKWSYNNIPNAMEIATLATKMTKKDIACHYGVAECTINAWCIKLGIPHTIKELAQYACEQNPDLRKEVEAMVKKSEHKGFKKKKNFPDHLQNTLPHYFCKQCGKPLKTNVNLCLSCANRKVVDRPSPIEIAQKVKEKGFWRGARDYGVTDNAVRKWCKEYGIPTHTKELISWLEQQETPN